MLSKIMEKNFYFLRLIKKHLRIRIRLVSFNKAGIGYHILDHNFEYNKNYNTVKFF